MDYVNRGSTRTIVSRICLAAMIYGSKQWRDVGASGRFQEVEINSYGPELNRGAMTPEDFISKAVELKLDGVDMTAYYLKSTEPEYLDGLRHLAYKNAMPFSGSACGVSMVQDSPAQRADSLNQIKKWVDVTGWELPILEFSPVSCHPAILCRKPWAG